MKRRIILILLAIVLFLSPAVSKADEETKLNKEEYPNTVKVVESLMDAGLTKEAACAIAGNFMQESSGGADLNPSSMDSSGNGGLAGWTPATDLVNTANEKGVEWDDIDFQIEYLLDNFNWWGTVTKSYQYMSSAKSSYTQMTADEFKKSTDLENATDNFLVNFEECIRANTSYLIEGKHMTGEERAIWESNKRVGFAKAIYEMMGGSTTDDDDDEDMVYFHEYRFVNVIRNCFANIDYYIYSSIEWIIQGVFDLATLRNNVDIVSTVRNKLYVLLGIFMFFKLSANFIKYMIKPDEMVDEKKGAKNLVLRTIVMLVVILMLPSAFEILYKAQTVFVPMVPKIILGSNEETAQKDIVEKSEQLAITIFHPFFHPVYNSTTEFASRDGSQEITTLAEFVEHVNDISPLGVSDNTSGYSYQYRYLLSSIVGILSLGLLAAIAISTASRIFKLMVLEMIAPIPVMNNISSNNTSEQNPFVEWIKEVLVTFLDLFTKLTMLYLIIYFSTEIADNNMFISWESAEGRGISPERLLYLKSILVVGLLLMTYKIPKSINKMFGINETDGSFVASLGSGIVGLGTGLMSGLISGQGIKGSMTQGINVMRNKYREAANQKLNAAWNNVEVETGENSRIERKGATFAFHSNVNDAKIKAEGNKTRLADNIKEDRARDEYRQRVEEANSAGAAYRTVVESGPQTNESPEDYSNRRNNAYSNWQEKLKISKRAEANYKSSKESYDRSNNSSYLQEANLPTTETGQVVMTTETTTTTIAERREENQSVTNMQ